MKAIIKDFFSLSPYYALVFVGCWLGGIFDGMDSNLFPVLVPNIMKDLLGTTDKIVVSQNASVITAVYLLGWTAGGILIGLIGDKLGRVKSMVLSILLYSIFTGLVGLCQDIWQLGACRFLTGLGIGGELVSISTLLSEVWPERSRAFAVGALITSYQAGVLLSGLVTQAIPDWRMAFFVGALPALLALLLRMNLKEPEKWQQAKADDAEQKLPLLRIFESQFRKNLIIGSLAFAGLLVGYWASLVWVPTWIQDLLGPDHVGTEKSTATIYHSILGIAGCLSSGILANYIGRRFTILTGAIGAFLSCLFMFKTLHSFSDMVYVGHSSLGFFTGMLQGVIYIYLPELFPTILRATAVGFCLNAGRIAAAFAALNVGTLVKLLGGYDDAAMAFAYAFLLSALIFFVAPETRGQTLPE